MQASGRRFDPVQLHHNLLLLLTIERLKNEKNFCLSYGDGLSNVNIKKLIEFHLKNKKMATLTAVKYKNPKGVLSINKNLSIKNIK